MNIHAFPEYSSFWPKIAGGFGRDTGGIDRVAGGFARTAIFKVDFEDNIRARHGQA